MSKALKRERASFDVFDTTVARLTLAPDSLFFLLGYLASQKKLTDDSPQTFHDRRVRAEALATQNRGRQVTLDEIYLELLFSSAWTPRQCDEVKAIEIELEKKLTHPLPSTLKKIERFRSRLENVIFISDMYLPTPVIKEILIKHGAFKSGDGCFVSSDSLRTKAQGTLFAKVSRANAGAYTHHGDNAHSDIVAARKAGFNAVLVDDAKPTRFENLLEQSARETCGLSSLLAGIGRKVRLQEMENSSVVPIATGVAAPFLVAYVEWVLRKAHAAGLTDLYFVARDGEILFEIAKVLLPGSSFQGRIRLMHGGRRAWLFPALDLLEGKLADHLLGMTDKTCPDDLLAVCRVDPDLLKQYIDWPKTIPNRPFRPGEESRYRALLENEEVKTKILEQIREQRRLLKIYLSRLGISRETRWGFVEIGWAGRVQEGLAAVLREAQLSQPTSFYVGLSKRAPGRTFPNQFCYLYEGNENQGHLDLTLYLWILVEIFCAADHASVVGFEETSEIEPVLAYPGQPPNAAWSPVLRRVVLHYAEHFKDLAAFKDLFAMSDLRPALKKLITELWFNPTKEEAVVFSQFTFENGAFGSRQDRLALPLGLSDVLQRERLAYPRRPPSFWLPGARVISPAYIIWAMRAANLLRHLRKVMRRRIQRFKT